MQDLQDYSAASAQTQSSNSATIQAVLCWSEFYNGAWQPTRTSDSARPATIGNYDPTGNGSFDADRNRVRIVPVTFDPNDPIVQQLQVQFSLPPDALILLVAPAGDIQFNAGFILYNSHSIPVLIEDVPIQVAEEWRPYRLIDFLERPNPDRQLLPSSPYTGTYGSAAFTINYYNTPGTFDEPAPSPAYVRQVLGYYWQPRYVQPEPGTPDAWDAPFIFENRRHVFYVTTTEDQQSIFRFGGFGLGFNTTAEPVLGAGIAPLALATTPALPADPVQNFAAGLGNSGDPLAVQRFLGASTSLKFALGSSATVSYQGQVVAPTGSLTPPTVPAATPKTGE
jgi:hypothetical protein